MLRIRIEIRPQNGNSITPEELGKLLFDLQAVKEAEGFHCAIGEPDEDGSRKTASVSFTMDPIAAMQVAITLKELGISYVPNLSSTSVKEAAAFLDHDRVYRVEVVKKEDK